MRLPPNGESRPTRDHRFRARDGSQPDRPQRNLQRQQAATPAVTSSITNRVSLLQDEVAEVATTAADVAWASDERAWAEAATHLLSATCELWMAAEALAEWGIAS
jgi:hypothetical protein